MSGCYGGTSFLWFLDHVHFARNDDLVPLNGHIKRRWLPTTTPNIQESIYALIQQHQRDRHKRLFPRSLWLDHSSHCHLECYMRFSLSWIYTMPIPTPPVCGIGHKWSTCLSSAFSSSDKGYLMFCFIIYQIVISNNCSGSESGREILAFLS